MDYDTYWVCSKLSRCFRRHCLKNLRFIKDTVFKDGHFPSTAQSPEIRGPPNTETLVFDLFDAVTDPTVPSQIKSGNLTDAERRSRRSRKTQEKESTIWQVLVGRHPTLSRVVCFVFSNFQAQLRWQGSEATAIPEPPSPRRMPQLTPAPSEQYWEPFLVYEAVNLRNLSSEAVFNIWRTILPLHNLRLNTKDEAWTVPPNTRYGYVADIISKGDVKEEYEKQWVMCLVVKRSSATTQPSEVRDRALEEAEAEVETTLADLEGRLTAYRFASRLPCRMVRQRRW